MKKIYFRDIVKMNSLIIDIYCLEDSDYVDGRTTSPKYRVIDRILNRITNDEEERRKIYDIVYRGSFNVKDRTFKPICDNLREIGYKIEFEEVYE